MIVEQEQKTLLPTDEGQDLFSYFIQNQSKVFFFY